MLTHKGTQTIKTKRLILRRFVIEDAQAMFSNWASDPEVTQFMTWPTHSDFTVSRMVLESWCKGYSQDNVYQWAIVPENLEQPIGSISVVYTDEDTNRMEIGYCIGRPWWHQGFTSEALAAVIRYLFEEVGVNRIQACHDINNPNSGGVMRKCGMSYEGTLRQYGRNNQGIVDIAIYSILRSEHNG